MTNLDIPFDIEAQIDLMKNYVVFIKRTKMRNQLKYTGYFRLSRYGKYLLSYTNILKNKPKQDLLFDIYKLDTELRKLLFSYCKKAEIQFKSNFSNAVSLKVNDSKFYLDDNYYTKSCGENDKKKRSSSIKFYPKFKKNIVDTEKKLRTNVNKYPEFKEYRTGGSRNNNKVPCWAAFSQFEFGLVTMMYSYLRGDLRKEVLIYSYGRQTYNKRDTKVMDTWLDAIRNLRNTCSHHNRLIGKTSSIVLLDKSDEDDLLLSETDLFSRLYALKKVLNIEDAKKLKMDLQKLIRKSNVDIYKFDILPEEWETLFDRINYL